MRMITNITNKKAESKFEEFLRGKGLRLTAQRNFILNAFLSNEGHLTAEDLLEIVKRWDKSIGQATVYRTLKLLSESGMAAGVDLGDGIVRYEHAFGHGHHDHLICLRCKKIVEALDPEIERLQERLAERNGFEIRGHRLDIFGVCGKCAKKTGH